jgi:hypothetical protein
MDGLALVKIESSDRRILYNIKSKSRQIFSNLHNFKDFVIILQVDAWILEWQQIDHSRYFSSPLSHVGNSQKG